MDNIDKSLLSSTIRIIDKKPNIKKNNNNETCFLAKNYCKTIKLSKKF